MKWRVISKDKLVKLNKYSLFMTTEDGSLIAMNSLTGAIIHIDEEPFISEVKALFNKDGMEEFYKFIKQEFDNSRFSIFFEPIKKLGGVNDENIAVLSNVKIGEKSVQLSKISRSSISLKLREIVSVRKTETIFLIFK